MRLLGEPVGLSSADQATLDQAVLQDGSRNVLQDLTFDADLILSSANPTLTIGDGTGDPLLELVASFNQEPEIGFVGGPDTERRWTIRGFDDSDDKFKLGRSNRFGGFQAWALQMDNGNGDAQFENAIACGGAVVADGVSTSDALIIGDGTGDQGLTVFGGSANTCVLSMTDTSATAIANLLYDHNKTRWEWTVEGTSELILDSTTLTPFADGGLDLGASATRYAAVYAQTFNASEGVTGILYREMSLAYEDGSSTSLHYAPIKGSLLSSSTNNAAGYWFIAPYDGQLIEVLALGETGGAGPTPGSTIIGLHKNFSGTAADTDTQNMSSNTTVYTFEFSTATFSKGDRISISVDPTNAPQRLSLTLKMTMDTRT